METWSLVPMWPRSVMLETLCTSSRISSSKYPITADGTLRTESFWGGLVGQQRLNTLLWTQIPSPAETDGNLTAVCVCVFSVPWHSSKVIHIIHRPQAPEIILIFWMNSLSLSLPSPPLPAHTHTLHLFIYLPANGLGCFWLQWIQVHFQTEKCELKLFLTLNLLK